MRARSLLLLLLLTLIAAFVAVNWSVINAPASLSLGVTQVQAPLGTVMLGLMAILCVAFVVQLALSQGSFLVEARRHAKEMKAQRDLADQAEASRFTELRGVMEAQLRTLAERMDQSEESLRAEIREHANSLAAMLGQIDDRMGGDRAAH